ncbi:glycosyltransferase [Fusobacterium perfoetens]|uniref:glycosyltransferase n=1 Tax=Fusobacterium perfoetens TaxID=852 RepID=UPI0026EC5FB8|nr:glycosyltransferase [Fusobacterium perfoetens]
MGKNFVHICEEFEYTWIGKDNGMIPIYAHEILGYNSKIVTCDLKKDLPDEIRGVEIVKISRWIKNIGNFAPLIIFIKRLPLYYWIIRNAKEIDVLMLFHMTKCSYWNAYFYKKFNPNGKVYVKADFNLDVYNKELERTRMRPKNIREFFRKRREVKEYNKRKKLAEIIDKISYETRENFEIMKESYAGIDTRRKVFYFPNGYDDLYIEQNFKIKSYEEKENIFLTVGRLGTYEKNTELLLNILEKIELGDWKFYLIGPIEKEFQEKIENFYKKNPTKKKNVIFTGIIKDKKQVYDYYNRAKVFVLSSRYESFGIVLSEAIAFNNYILSTDTGAIRDILNEKSGKIIDENDLLNSMEEIISGKNIEVNDEKKESFKYSNLIKEMEKL